VFEAGRQQYDIDLDAKLLNNEFFGVTGSGGGGKRKRYAAGAEFSIPVFQPLQLKLAGRFDQYDDITAVDNAFTYNAGIEYRPISQVLLRGAYATSFRAPDMHYVFADPNGYFTTVTDEYLCRRDEPGVSLAACTSQSGGSLQGSRQGNPGLEEETSDSYTYGFVVQPTASVMLSVDYYNIKLNGAVLDDPLDRLLETEADCRLGATKSGAGVDITSARCQSAMARITRHPTDGSIASEFLENAITGPINTAKIHTSGIDAAARWTLRAGALGRFDLQLAYSQVLKFDQQDFASDPTEDKLASLQYFDWHSRSNAGLTWTKGQLSSTAFVTRNGSVPNWAETGRIGSFTTVNLSARYSGLLGGDAYIGFAVQNLFDRNPPRDPTFDTYPYYSDFNYNAVGREVFLDIGVSF
jgi:outer membrane receptor protein involved in Fe transport